MFSKLLVCFALATAVNGQATGSQCLEDGHPDNDCCALPGHMSCSGGNRLKPTNHVCWSGTYQGKQYTGYNFACYPTQAPDGHDASKCLEDGKADADCCALKGHEGCASGFVVQRSQNACFSNPQFTAYNYFCTPKGGANKNDAACAPSRCTSPGPNGNHDCWAGNGEPFTCSGDYSPKMTGKKTTFQGKTWKEYTCCPGSLSDCATDKCTSPDGQGGQDCWAGNGEPFTCQTGFIPKMTGQTAPSGGKTWREYKCCPPPSKCSASQCTSPNGQGGHDCWAGNGEAFTCAAGYSSKMTGQTAPYGGQTWHEYTCCKVGGKRNNNYVSDNSKCVATACREYSKDKADSDCCGKIGETFCADGFNLRYRKNDQTCERYSTQHRGTCCVKNGQKHRQNFKNDKSKCRSHQEADKNCCAFASGAACADGYKMTMKQTDDNICFKYQSYKAFKYTCTPPSSLSGRKSDSSKCREHGRNDKDCCALQGTGSCAGGYDFEQTQHVCFKNEQFTAYSYHCLKPDVVVVHG